MKIAYWILAGLLSLLYLFSAGKKVSQSQDQLKPMMGWVDTVPMWLVRIIGVIEIAGVAGLLLPPLTGVAPRLAVFAAAGFVALQVLATGLHWSRGEVKESGFNLTLIAAAGITTWLATVW